MNRASVLIIDDEENLRQLLARIIELEGYSVLQATTGKSGLKILERNLIQVALIDVKLPDANGIELMRKIKSAFPDVEVVILTAFGTIQDGVQAIKNGAFDYLTKGDNKDKIIPLLAKASEKASAAKEAKSSRNAGRNGCRPRRRKSPPSRSGPAASTSESSGLEAWLTKNKNPRG